ncbi:MAG: restriction endonuclease subunit S [Longimicrobiales bacterium]|nr:restriction endonuclease subunit S [Longimicrobiales bacterium]
MAGWKAYVAYRDSGVGWLGEVPEGWEARRLKTIARARPSNVDKKTEEGQRPVRLCNYVDVYKNEFITADLEFMLATATEAQLREFRVRPGDVLATKDSETADDIAVPALVLADEADLVCGYHLTLIRPDPRTALGAYLFRAMQAIGVSDQFRLRANGVTRFGLPVSAFTEAIFPLPPLPEQRAIAAFLDREAAIRATAGIGGGGAGTARSTSRWTSSCVFPREPRSMPPWSPGTSTSSACGRTSRRTR